MVHIFESNYRRKLNQNIFHEYTKDDTIKNDNKNIFFILINLWLIIFQKYSLVKSFFILLNKPVIVALSHLFFQF